jgi:hypothetical protein
MKMSRTSVLSFLGTLALALASCTAILVGEPRAEILHGQRDPMAVLVVMFVQKGELVWRISEEPGPKACEIKAGAVLAAQPYATVRCFTVRDLKDA